MASRLSNELIKKVLSFNFHVPDVMFRDVSSRSPFFRLSHQPASVLLLVCKKWMTVATPLLYEVVILRSKAQALALERTLQTCRSLGAHVRKLRAEGGLGAAMGIIITCSSNITDLCLSLDLHSRMENVKGLVRSLDTINPTCLVILDPRETEVNNAQLNKLVSKLTCTFGKWTNLNEVYVSGMEDHIDRWCKITSALADAKNLHTVTVPLPRCTEDTVRELRNCPSLRLIRIVDTEGKHEGETSHNKAFRDYVNSDPRLQVLVMFETPSSPCCFIPDIPVFNTAYIPLANTSKEVRDLVWNRVLRFVFGIDLNDVNTSHWDGLSFWDHNDNSIARVSKTFHRLSLPYIYGFIAFFDDRSLRKYTSSIQRNPSLGRHLRSLQILPTFLASVNLTVLRKFLHIIIGKAPNLTKLHAMPIKNTFRSLFESHLPLTLDTFQTLAATAGPRLSSILDIDVSEGMTDVLCPSVLHRFRVLRTLRCEVTANFDSNLEKIVRKSMPALESLQISHCTPSFFKVISNLRLPSLREFEIKYPNEVASVIAFLQTHGKKIERLGISPRSGLKASMFKLCPNMTCLKIYFSPNTNDRQFLQATHARLTKIIFDRTDGDDFGPPVAESPEYISTLRFSDFPALREIQVPFLDWPATEFEISKSKWPECSEFLASQGIKLTDGEGRSWRPRLKA